MMRILHDKVVWFLIIKISHEKVVWLHANWYHPPPPTHLSEQYTLLVGGGIAQLAVALLVVMGGRR